MEQNFTLPQDLNAMAKTFYVKVDKPLREESWYLKKGSTVTGVKVIAEGTKIKKVDKLVEQNILPNGQKTNPKDWFKCRGTAEVTNGRDIYKNCEIHWYQCAEIGKVDFKVKVWGDKVEN